MEDLPRPTFAEVEQTAQLRKDGDLGSWLRTLGGMGAKPQGEYLKIQCPRCKAPQNQMCTNHLGRRLTSGVHEARIDATSEPEKVAQPRPGAWPVARKSGWPT